MPADADTVYRIGSITKMFTALMLEQLVEAGKVHLSDPAEKYFPEIKTVQGRFPDAPPITLIQLATHTSGLGREPDNTEIYVTAPVADWEKTLIAALPHTHYDIRAGHALLLLQYRVRHSGRGAVSRGGRAVCRVCSETHLSNRSG